MSIIIIVYCIIFIGILFLINKALSGKIPIEKVDMHIMRNENKKALTISQDKW